jgi:hypothetical protein
MSLVQYADWGGANQQWQLVPISLPWRMGLLTQTNSPC